MRSICLLILYITTFCSSCDSSKIEPATSRIGRDFFPLVLGSVRTYEVESKEYQLGEEIVSNFQLREEIKDSFLDQSGDSVYVIQRYTRASGLDDWAFKETWSAKNTSNGAIEFEGAVPYLKISYPISTGLVWDGNALNTQEKDEYKADSVFYKYESKDNVYDKTLTVIQNNNEDLIVEFDKRYELYALNIGLILKEEKVLVFCGEDDCLGQQIIESGREWSQRLISYEEN